jgi:hypothetical protein
MSRKFARLLWALSVVAALGFSADAQAELLPRVHYCPFYRTHYYHGHPPVYAPLQKPEWFHYGHFGAHPAPVTLDGHHDGYLGNRPQMRFRY